MTWQTDVCVVGAGPAGASFATRMSQFGHRVTLVERSRFPRSHVGEAMTPMVWDLLDVTGARPSVEALPVVRTPRARVRWVDDRVRLVDSLNDKSAFTVERAQFDQALVDTAVSAGVTVLQPAIANSPRRIGSGWELGISGLPGISSMRTRFLVDATGRGGLLPGHTIRVSPNTISLDGLWTFEQAANCETQIEAGPEGWFWGAHLPGGTFRAMAFVDSDLLRRHQIGKAELESFYRTLLSGTRVLGALRRPQLAGRVSAHSATCYYDPEPIEMTSIKVGESAFAIDPLSSSGVQKALQSSLAGSIAVNTILLGGDVAAAIDFYLDNHRRSVMQHAEWATTHYREHRRYRAKSFWRQRSQMPTSGARRYRRAKPNPTIVDGLRLAPGVRIVRVPCAVGDRVEMRDAFTSAWLARPVAFLNGIDMAPVIGLLTSANGRKESTASHAIPHEHLSSIVSSLVRQGVLDGADRLLNSCSPSRY